VNPIEARRIIPPSSATTEILLTPKVFRRKPLHMTELTYVVKVNRRHRAYRPQTGTHVRMATEVETLFELTMVEATHSRATPLFYKLQTRTLTRRGYKQIVSILAENLLLTGQPEQHAALAAATAEVWKKCPARWLGFNPFPLVRAVATLMLGSAIGGGAILAMIGVAVMFGLVTR